MSLAKNIEVKTDLEKNKEYCLRQLAQIWVDFETALDNVPIIAKLQRGKFRLEDYKLWLLNHRQQVIEGGRWISLAASSIGHEHADLRSKFIKHAATEHKDYKMLEKNYVSIGGSFDEIQAHEKNIGSEALSSFMYHQASQPNPLHLLGAMFIIEGLGQNKASKWAELIQEQLNLEDSQVEFLKYHGENDEDHMEEFYEVLLSDILEIDGMVEKIIKTAKVTARLYLLQLEEIGNY